MCARLERVALGREAERLLPDVPDAAVGVVQLPVWWWGEAQIDMGAKDRARHGGRLHMPVRYLWSSPLLVLVPPGASVDLSWSVRGLGHDRSGVVRYTSTDTVVSGRCVIPDHGSHVGGVLRAGDVRRELDAIVQDGKLAWWELLGELEGRVRSVVNRMHAYLSNDVAQDPAKVRYLLDETAIDSLVNAMMYGQEDITDAEVPRILERALAPGALARVDPLKFVLDAVRVAAIDAIRRRTGDPGVGSKIRSIAREIGSWDPERVHRTYRQRWPGDHLGIDRTRRALTVRPDPMASPVDLDTLASLSSVPYGRSA